MPGAHTTLRIVSESEWKSLRLSARFGSPSALRTAAGSDTARARTSRIALWVESAAKAARQSATNCSVSNTSISFGGKSLLVRIARIRARLLPNKLAAACLMCPMHLLSTDSCTWRIDMELRQLRTFVVVAEAGGFASAHE